MRGCKVQRAGRGEISALTDSRSVGFGRKFNTASCYFGMGRSGISPGEVEFIRRVQAQGSSRDGPHHGSGTRTEEYIQNAKAYIQ